MSLGTFVGVLIAAEHAQTPFATRPNIVFISSDDHAVRTISTYGSGINKTLFQSGVPFQRWQAISGHFTGYATDVITDQALAWMDAQSDSAAPFLLMCQFKSLHIHRVPPPRHVDKYDDVDIPEPVNMFDDYQGRTAYASNTYMEFKTMGERILNFPPPAGEQLVGNDRNKYDYLVRMTAEQRDAYHRAYDPDNRAYSRLRTAGKLDDDSEELEKYKYQRFMKDYLRCVAAIDDNVGRILDYLDD